MPDDPYAEFQNPSTPADPYAEFQDTVTATPPKPVGWRDKLDQALTISPAHVATLRKLDKINSMGAPTAMTSSPNQISNLALAGSGVLRGGARMITHPIDTLSSLAQGLYDLPASSAELLGNAPQIAAHKPLVNTPSSDRIQAQIDSLKEAAHDPEKAGELIGQTIVGEGLGRLTGAGVNAAAKGVRAIPKVANIIGSNVERALTNTTPRDVGDYARSVAKENVKATAKDAATGANAQDAAAAAAAREAAQNHINTIEPQIKARLKTAQTNALAKANGKYDSLNTALEGEQTHPEFAQELLDDATNSMKGSATETPIMKDIEDQFMPVKRSQTGKIMRDEDGEPIREDSQPISYRDLQGYRSEINAALKGHNLPGDVYQAYKGMLDSIDDQMQKIADRNNLGDDMADARSTWQKYANTFQEPSSPAYKALYSKFPKNGAAIRVFQNNDAGLNALAAHDPALAADIDQARKIQASTRGAAPQARPSAPQSTVKVVQPEDVQQAKADNVIDSARKKARQISGAGASIPAIWDIAHGRVPNLAELAMTGGGGAAIGTVLDRYFTSPKALARLSEVTPADFMELQRHLPPEQIGDFSQVLARAAAKAKSQGITVSPAVRQFLAATGAAQGLALPSSHPLSSQFIPQVATGATK